MGEQHNFPYDSGGASQLMLATEACGFLSSLAWVIQLVKLKRKKRLNSGHNLGWYMISRWSHTKVPCSGREDGDTYTHNEHQ